MAYDHTYNEINRGASERMRKLTDQLSDQEMLTRVGEHWTVGIALAHLAFWDRRVIFLIDRIEKGDDPAPLNFDIVLNDILLPLWGAIPPREAARLAIETAELLDKKLETLSSTMVEELFQMNSRIVVRGLHRNEHLDDIDAALKG